MSSKGKTLKGRVTKSYIHKKLKIAPVYLILQLFEETISTVTVKSKQSKSKKNASEEIDILINVAYVIKFTKMKLWVWNGLSWCLYFRWLYKECIQYDVTISVDGREMLCAFLYAA